MDMVTKTNGITVDQWMLWVTAAGVLVTLLLGIVSIIVASRANGRARRANVLGGEANAIAKEANEIATSARGDARAAAIDARWTEALSALAPFLNFDPVHNDMQPMINRLRPALQLLADSLRWEGFGHWVGLEMQCGVALLQEMMERGKPVTVEQTIETTRLPQSWAAAFNDQLREFWRDELDAAVLARVTSEARQHRDSVFQRNDWDISIDNLRPSI